jgi:hypothetical protein
MSSPLSHSIRVVLALSVSAAALTAISLPARAHDRGGIAAGVAGGVAGTIAGEALLGAHPPTGYYAPANPPPVQDCVWEHRQEQGPYYVHIGSVRVCQ